MSADGQGAERAAPSPAGTSAAGPGEHQVEQPAPDTGTRGQTLAASSSRLSGIHMGSDGVIRITPEFVQAMSGGTAALLPEQATSNRSRSSLRRGFFNTPAASSGSKSARRDVGGASTPQAQPLPGSGPAPGTSQWWSDRAAVLGLDGAPWKVAGNGELILDAPGNINAVVRLLASVANALPREAKAQVANALKAAAGSSSSAAPADSTSLLSPEARLLFGDKDLLESLGNAVDFQLGRAAPEEPERTPADQNQHDGSRNEADKDVFAGQGAQEDRKAGTTVPSSQPSSPCMDDVWDDRCMVCGMWCDDTQDHDEDTMWSYGCEQQGCTNVMCRLCLSPTEMSDADSQAWRCPSCRGAPLPPPHAGSERKGSNKMVCRRFRDQWETAGEGRTITFRSDVWEVAGWHFQLRVDCTKPRNERTARDAAAKPPKGRKVAKARDARDGSSRGKAQEDAKLKAYLYLVDSEGKDYKDGRKLLHVGGKFVFIFLHQEDTDDDNIRRKACAPGSLFTNLIKNSKDSTSWGWADVPVSTLLHDGFLTDAGDLEIVVEVEVVNDIIEQLSMDDEIKASVCGVLGLLGDQGAFMKTIREKRANLESSGHKFPTRRECWTGGCTVFSKRREALETLCTELYWDSSRRSVMQSLLESDGYLAVRLKVMVRWVDILIAAESAGQEWPVSSSDDIPLLLLVGRLAVDFGKR
ncbi:unnamed protein product [Pedinophyceae sp. YPF-701]|nr:unnamed protein product [Pedinophyceae sp. YPF-701]